MTASLGHVAAIKRHNRPYTGLWFLKQVKNGEPTYISFQLSRRGRYWTDDPIFEAGDKLVILSIKESSRAPIPGRLGWEVKALDQKLNPFEFFWDDETAFRTIWER